ncbi:MAG: Cys-tRNA(Pro) deacylase [Clostridia bacterium]|nr:Cys-tRNA(Pro) deacylase [Clostridia bacterium]
MAKDKKTVTNAMRMLTAAKIEFKTIEYEAEAVGDHFGETIAEMTGMPPEMSFKTLVARGDKTGIFVMCIPVADEVDLKKAAKVSGNKRAEMIHVKELLGLTGYIRGGVSPIGMKKKYPTYVHASAEALNEIAVSGGRCGTTLVLSPKDLQKATDCVFVDIIRE